MTGFTKGPWAHTETNSRTGELDQYYIYIDPGVAVIERSTCNHDEDMANARLISAAPELLEALEARMRLGGYSNPEKHADGSYVSSAMELWWQGWNAALESLVVELLPMHVAGEMSGACVLYDCKEAIHAAGVKTK